MRRFTHARLVGRSTLRKQLSWKLNPNAARKAHVGDIEEGRDAYRAGGFHPVYIGEVYAENYGAIRKIGHGRFSKVWPVKDLSAWYVLSGAEERATHHN